MHDLLIGIVFIGMVAVPCIIAARAGAGESEA